MRACTERLSQRAGIAAIAAGELQINDLPERSAGSRTFAFDVLNGGLGFLDACHVATQMIRADRYRTGMVMAAEIENNADAWPET